MLARSLSCTWRLARRAARHSSAAAQQPLPRRPRSCQAPAAPSNTAAATVVERNTQQQQQSPIQKQQQRQQHQPEMYFLVKNTEALPCPTASGQWLEAAPRGAYTTARTCGDSVFELSFHLDRLASSARLMMEADAQAAATAAAAAAGTNGSHVAPSATSAADPAVLRPMVLAALQAAVRGYRATSGDAAGELKLTVLLTWPGSAQHEAPPTGAAADVYVHVSPLPPRPAPPVRVVMRGAPRQNAAAKDSEWVRQRKALERGLPPGVNEVLLVDDCGSLYEGLSSNFFAVLDGRVYTAGQGVLAGTVREVTLQVARREGIPVVLEPPRIQDLARWEGCFITSTSRLLLPVDEAAPMPPPEEQPEGEQRQWQQLEARRFERGGLVTRLERLVLAEVQAASEPLF